MPPPVPPPVLVKVDLEKCDFTDRKKNAPKKRDGGSVNFKTPADCTIQFSDDAVFGQDPKVFPKFPKKDLNKGDNIFAVEANQNVGSVTTVVSLVGCQPKEQRIMSDPIDIIVP